MIPVASVESPPGSKGLKDLVTCGMEQFQETHAASSQETLGIFIANILLKKVCCSSGRIAKETMTRGSKQ